MSDSDDRDGVVERLREFVAECDTMAERFAGPIFPRNKIEANRSGIASSYLDVARHLREILGEHDRG